MKLGVLGNSATKASGVPETIISYREWYCTLRDTGNFLKWTEVNSINTHWELTGC